MGIEEFLRQFNGVSIALFVLFALPGFISFQVWSVIFPTRERVYLKDRLPEAIGFGVLNSIIFGPLVVLVAPTNPWLLYLSLVFALAVMPALWPFLFRYLLGSLYAAGHLKTPVQDPWDVVFLKREPLFVIVHLKDGRRVGGYYGTNSFAGLHPMSGHLYLETLWRLNVSGQFLAPIPDSRGIVLRPDDYQFIELLSAVEATDDGI